jgi:hypothetical protein
VTDSQSQRTWGIWAGGFSIVTGLVTVPWLVLGDDSIRVWLVLVLSIITQLVSGATLLYAALAARDTDKLTAD